MNASTTGKDLFAYERLPPRESWPDLLLPPEFTADAVLNCTGVLLDRHLDGQDATRTALTGSQASWTYAQLNERVNRIANVLVRDLGIVPGNRVLMRGANSPMLGAIWLAIQKVGAIAVTTMSLLRAGELRTILEIAQPQAAVVDTTLAADLQQAMTELDSLDCALLGYGEGGAELERRLAAQADEFDTVDTLSSDISLIAFTSGTTGRPKATVHFQRDVLAICQAVAGDVLQAAADDVFIGTPPLAFTFGLGGLLLFPLFAGASAVLYPRYSPPDLLAAIKRHRATVCFTVPTFYRQMAALPEADAAAGLRLAVSSGEALPLPVRGAWRAMTGLDLTEFLGSTEMLHAFVAASGTAVREGYIGRAVPGYEVAILGENGRPLAPGRIGRLAVKGPTGCRYLDDARQADYVQSGWNVTGDACAMDEDGYVAYHARLDDMIISAGYNISGLEVENMLLTHPAVLECAVVGLPDPARGQIVAAFVVPDHPPDHPDEFKALLQGHVRSVLAPYKYPRRIELLKELPRNEPGKLQRFRLRVG